MLHYTAFQSHEQRRMTHSAALEFELRLQKYSFIFWRDEGMKGFEGSESGLLQISKSSLCRLLCHIVEKPATLKRMNLWTQCFLKMVLWNGKRPGSDFSLSLFEARTETYLLQSMTNCFCFSRMSKHSAAALWLNMAVWYPLSEQIWTRPHPCPLLTERNITLLLLGYREEWKEFALIYRFIYWERCLFCFTCLCIFDGHDAHSSMFSLHIWKSISGNNSFFPMRRMGSCS